jgi:hypothetical protein
MTYKNYKMKAERLSELLQTKHQTGLTPKQEVELEKITQAIMPYAF